MLRNVILSGLIAASAAFAVAPSAASAQVVSFSVSSGSGYHHRPGFYDRRYYGRPHYGWDRRSAWIERRRWEDRRRWAYERRRDWDRGRWDGRRW